MLEEIEGTVISFQQYSKTYWVAKSVSGFHSVGKAGLPFSLNDGDRVVFRFELKQAIVNGEVVYDG